MWELHLRCDLTLLKGLDDLKDGVIRTPLAPRETFLDDPLRVLRCIRFASRFGYQIEESAWIAMKDPEIQVVSLTRCRLCTPLTCRFEGRSSIKNKPRACRC